LGRGLVEEKEYWLIGICRFGETFIDGMAIDAKVEEHGREQKVIVFKFKRRKGYQEKT
jgi:ribosomal protein L21